jgi:histidinol dehydrogenase
MKRILSSELPPAFFDVSEGEEPGIVRQIIDDVRARGDQALRMYTKKFDKVEVDSFRVQPPEILEARRTLDKELGVCLEKAAFRIKTFAEKQFESLKNFQFEIESGVQVGQVVVPLERVGVYVPGGRYPLLSSVLMGAVPAKVAGVEKVVLCSPPQKNGYISSLILAAAAVAGIDEVYRIGGAQAIAAMAYGTQSLKPVHKIVGPGNVYVNAAKKQVFGKVGVDFIAGPTEILIIADGSADPALLAADLIAQAEHDVKAKAVLLTDSERLAEDVEREVERQMKVLKNEETVCRALGENGAIVLFDQTAEAVDIANDKAPEHLQLNVSSPQDYLPGLRNYGSLFIGEYTTETLGDYSSGLNHILPTNRASRYTGGLSVKDFVKIQTFLKVDQEGFKQIGPVAASLARAEGLFGHEAAVRLRLERLKT